MSDLPESTLCPFLSLSFTIEMLTALKIEVPQKIKKIAFYHKSFQVFSEHLIRLQQVSEDIF